MVKKFNAKGNIVNKFSVIFLAAIAASSVYAADIQLDDGPNGPPGVSITSLGGQFKTLAAELPGLNKTMSDTTDININLEKETKLYLDDQLRQKSRLAQAIVIIERDVKAPVEQRLIAAVNEYQGRCARQFNRDTEMNQYNQCVSDKARIENNQREATAWWENYVAVWNKANVDPVNAVILKQNAKIQQNNEQIKANFKLFTDAQDRFISVKARLKDILSNIKFSCANKPPPAGGKATYNEWVKWCANVDWDGANNKLPPMYKY